jgi:hypothetical protein
MAAFEREVHEMAQLFPLMDRAEYEAFLADIRDNGQREPIWIFEDKILDGRNRARACAELGIEVAVRVWQGDDPVAFVLSQNLHRRHLNESQRAAIAAEIASMRPGGQSVRRDGEPNTGTNRQICRFSQGDAAGLMNVSERSVRSARQVLDDGVAELVEAVKNGAVTLGAAEPISRLRACEQRKTVEDGPEAVRAKAAEIRGKAQVNGQPAAAPAADEDLLDKDWLATLPIRAKLSGRRLTIFDRDALAFRHLEPHRKAFQRHAARIAKGKGEYIFRTQQYIRIESPAYWEICAASDDGCDGKGQIARAGQCPRCQGQGYRVTSPRPLRDE